jgi:hypothetical protein
MIIKVKSKGNSWVLIDNAAPIKLDTTIHSFTSSSQLDYVLPLGAEPSVEVTYVLPETSLSEASQGNPLKVCVLEYQRNGKDCAVVFNTIAYICNDHGKTVDKVLCDDGSN